MDFDDEFPVSSLRLFLSVDIVGSTAFKQAAEFGSTDRTQNWLIPFTTFYAEFDSRLENHWESAFRAKGDDVQNAIEHSPVLWKARGDELIYVLDITSPYHPNFAVTTFCKAVNDHRKTIRQYDPALDLKATAWIAGFPVNNAEIVVGSFSNLKLKNPVGDEVFAQHAYRRMQYEQSDLKGQVHHLDFIGPQMDLGFRLANHSTPRRTMLSVDLCFLMADTCIEHGEHLGRSTNIEGKLFFDEPTSLKGVLSEIPYPLFWLDTRPRTKLNSAEDKLRDRDEGPKVELIRNYCREYINHFQQRFGWQILPFIVLPDGSRYGTEPEPHKVELESQRRRWRKILPMLEDNDPEPGPESSEKVTGGGDEKQKELLERVIQARKLVHEQKKIEGD